VPGFLVIILMLFIANGIILVGQGIMIVMVLYIANFQEPFVEWIEETWPKVV